MSLATLKRKTDAKYHNSSVGYAAFSLNGTHRSQGYVGQDMRGRHYTGPNTVEDASVVKSSVVSSYGQSAVHNRWIRRPANVEGGSSLKPDDNQNSSDYNAYKLRIEKRNAQEHDECGVEIETLENKLKLLETARQTAYQMVTDSIPLRVGQAKIFGSKAANTKLICNTVKDLSGESKSQSVHVVNVAFKSICEGEPQTSYKTNRCASAN